MDASNSKQQKIIIGRKFPPILKFMTGRGWIIFGRRILAMPGGIEVVVNMAHGGKEIASIVRLVFFDFDYGPIQFVFGFSQVKKNCISIHSQLPSLLLSSF